MTYTGLANQDGAPLPMPRACRFHFPPSSDVFDLLTSCASIEPRCVRTATHMHHATWVKWTAPSQRCRDEERANSSLLAQFKPYFYCSFGNQGDANCPAQHSDASLSYATVAGRRESLGLDCHIRAMPPGFGFRLRGEYRLSVLIDDVRLGGAGESTLAYVDAAVRVRAAEARPVELTLTKWFMPADPDFDAYAWRVPADFPSMHWASHRMPYAGRVVFTRVHTHQRFTEEVWLTAGASGNRIFGSEPSPAWTHARSWAGSPRLTLDASTSLQAFKEVARRRLSPAGAVLVCRYLGLQLTAEGFDKASPMVLGNSSLCLGHTFERAQWHTTIAFMRPARSKQLMAIHASWEAALAFEPDASRAVAELSGCAQKPNSQPQAPKDGALAAAWFRGAVDSRAPWSRQKPIPVLPGSTASSLPDRDERGHGAPSRGMYCPPWC